MAQLWIPHADNGASTWALVPLTGSIYEFIKVAPFVRRVASASGAPCCWLLQISQTGNGLNWLLLAARGVGIWLNGQRAQLGLRVLSDRDEIRVESGPALYFSSERLAEVVAFPGAEQELFCARCRNPIEKGSPAVCCPGCGAWTHQSQDLPCWLYPGTTHCPLCDQSTDPDAGYRWTPEKLAYEA